MSEQAPQVTSVQEQITPEQQAERERLAVALYHTMIHGEGQSDEPLEHAQILSEEDTAVHQELLGQLNGVNGTVPEQFQQKRDYSKSEWLQRSDERDKIEEVKQTIGERLTASEAAKQDKAERDAWNKRVDDHNRKIELREKAAEERRAVRDTYIESQRVKRGSKQFELYKDEIEAEADEYADKTSIEAAREKFGTVETNKARKEREEAAAKKREQAAQKNSDLSADEIAESPQKQDGDELALDDKDIPEFHPENLREQATDRKSGSFTRWNVDIDELALDDKDIPEFNPDNLKEQPIDWEDSDFKDWIVDPEEFFTEDDKTTSKELVVYKNRNERPVDAAIREFTEASRQNRAANLSPRNRLRRLMGRANDMLKNAAAWGTVISQPAFDKLQGYFGDEEKGQTRRRAAIAGAVLGPLAAYGAVRLGVDLTGGSPKGSTGGVKETLLPFTSPFGGGAKEHLASHAAQAHEAGRHAVTHAVKVANEITLKPNVPGGDSIWREEYNHAHTAHPGWNEHQLRVYANEHAQHILNAEHISPEQAKDLQPGATFKN